MTIIRMWMRYVILPIVPSDLLTYMPFGTLLGAVVGLGLLANNSELTVIQAAGVSRFKIVAWVMQPALVFVVIGLRWAICFTHYQSAVAPSKI